MANLNIQISLTVEIKTIIYTLNYRLKDVIAKLKVVFSKIDKKVSILENVSIGANSTATNLFQVFVVKKMILNILVLKNLNLIDYFL